MYAGKQQKCFICTNGSVPSAGCKSCITLFLFVALSHLGLSVVAVCTRNEPEEEKLTGKLCGNDRIEAQFRYNLDFSDDNGELRIKLLLHVGKYDFVFDENGEIRFLFFGHFCCTFVVVVGRFVRVSFPRKSKCCLLTLSFNACVSKSHLINTRVCK